MKYAILIGDGMADEPQAALDGKTPLEAASTPGMDALARSGRVLRVQTVPEGMPPGSDVANLSLLGYDPAAYYTGRAPIEAAGMGVELPPGATAFRCNLVSIRDGRMADYSAGAIETPDAHALVEELRGELGSDSVQLHPGVSYRHLLVVTGFPSGELDLTPPHDITDQPVSGHLPSGPGSDLLRDLMGRARDVLATSPVNARRKAGGKTPATDIWLWGHGAATVLPTLGKRYGLSGAVITAVDLVRGLGRLAGMEPIVVEGATGYLDTNYAGKVAAGLKALQTRDLIYLHVEAPDEASHEGSLEKKLQAIEDFDSRVVAEITRGVQSLGDVRILVLPDHPTFLSTRTHDSRPVPFVVAGAGIEPGSAGAYCERSAPEKPLYTGVSLFEEFLRGTFA